MAETTTVLAVTLVEENGRAKTFNLDNPRTENLNMNAIKTALQPSLNKGFWLGTYGSPLVAVQSASVNTAIKMQLSQGSITVSPSSLDIQYTGTTDPASASVNISNGYVSLATIEYNSNTPAEVKNVMQNPIISNNGTTVTVTLTSGPDLPSSYSENVGNLRLLIYGEIVNVPVSVSRMD